VPKRDYEPGSPEDLTDGILKYSVMLGTGAVGGAAAIGFIEKPSIVGGAVLGTSIVAEIVEFIKL
jgi:hypothetical protein